MTIEEALAVANRSHLVHEHIANMIRINFGAKNEDAETFVLDSPVARAGRVEMETIGEGGFVPGVTKALTWASSGKDTKSQGVLSS